MEKSKIIKLSHSALRKSIIDGIAAGDIAMIKLGMSDRKDMEQLFAYSKLEKSRRYYVHRKWKDKYVLIFKSFIETVVLHKEKVCGDDARRIAEKNAYKETYVLFFMVDSQYFAAIYAFKRKGEGVLCRIISMSQLENLNRRYGTKIGNALLQRRILRR